MAQPLTSVRVKGYREVLRALRNVDKNTKRTMLGALKDAAQPIADDAKGKLGGYAGLSTGSIAPRAVTNGVYVTQKKGKKTGLRPDFGALQMRVGLIPALDDNEDDIEDRVDHAIGVLINREGF